MEFGFPIETVALGGTAIVGVLATLILFLSLKRDISRAGRRERRRTEHLIAELDQKLEKKLAEAAIVPPAPQTPEPFHRARALRLLGSGVPLPQAARELGVPLGELELLERVTAFVRSLPPGVAPRQGETRRSLSSQQEDTPPLSTPERPVLARGARAGAGWSSTHTASTPNLD